jgi:16S rRNA (uracil1498-N3)-methyltransferase
MVGITDPSVLKFKMLFYLTDFSNPVLSETESQHIVKVLRKVKGDWIEVTDGLGNRANAQIEDAHHKHCRLSLISPTHHERPWKSQHWLGIAPTKNLDRMEWLVEKATEVGCNGFLFFRSKRTERDQLNLERLQKVAVAAMKQSGQNWLPEIMWVPKWELFPWKQFDQIYLADLEVEEKKELLKSDPGKGKSIWMIGPEGDFTPEERQTLKEHLAIPVSLGPTVLRTETAALYSLVQAHVLSRIDQFN